MSLRLIVGRAGSGKTRRCFDEICSRLQADPEGSALILLTPEQATFHSERALASLTPSGGLFRVHVLSFRRLAWMALNEAGGSSRMFITELGRRMILHSIIERHQKDLRIFGRAAGQTGFTNVMDSFLAELKLYRVPQGRLSSALDGSETGTRDRLGGKVHDIDLIYSELENHISGRYFDPDDYMNLLAGKIHLSPTIRGAEVWVDGFNGFSPQEYYVLEKLMQLAVRVNVTICADRKAVERMPREGELFHTTGETINKLTESAQKSNTIVEAPVFLEGCRRFSAVPVLDYLEKMYFSYPVRPFTGDLAGIKLVAAAGPRAEVEAAAREIISLCRDKGLSWREIAVLVRDLNLYRLHVTSVFKDYGIPCFIDHKQPVTHHPLVELIRSALEVLSGGWSYESVFRFLKTDLVPLSREEVDILENYVLAHGIRGAAWTSARDWDYVRRPLGQEKEAAEDRCLLEMVNRARRKGLEHLAAFCECVGKSPRTARAFSEALFNMLVDLDVPSLLQQWSAREEAAGNLVRASEHDRIWGLLIELLDQVVAAFGDSAMTPEKYAGILEYGLVELRLGLIPPGMDQVEVGTLDRSRSPAVRAVFVLGVNDGIFPARQLEDGILDDTERGFLSGKGVSLAPGVRRKVFDEQMLVYTALTRASGQLWMSYSLSDNEGRSLAPSRIIQRICELLPGMVQQTAAVEPGGGEDDLSFVAEGGRTLGCLAAGIREYLAGAGIHPLWWDVYNWYVQEDSFQDRLALIRKGIFYENNEDNLPSRLTGMLYGDRLRLGVSEIESFNACPFAHFLKYGIKLKERLHYKLTPPDTGEFFHLALKEFALCVVQETSGWGKLNRDEIARLADEIITVISPRLQNEILLSTARYRYMTARFKRRLIRSAEVLNEHFRRGKFRPVALEIGFGPGEKLPPVRVTLPGGKAMEITGRIDRIDACSPEEGNYIIVIDYKTGFSRLDLKDIYYGINVQLPAYLGVAADNSVFLTGRRCSPAGIFYFTVADPLINLPGPVEPQEAAKMILKKLKLKGMLLADRDVVGMIDAELERHSDIIQVSVNAAGQFYKNNPAVPAAQFDFLRGYLKKIYRQVGKRIFSGEVGIRPIKRKKYTACDYCRFKSVCRFDSRVAENRYRIMPEMDSRVIWQKMAQAADMPEVD